MTRDQVEHNLSERFVSVTVEFAKSQERVSEVRFNSAGCLFNWHKLRPDILFVISCCLYYCKKSKCLCYVSENLAFHNLIHERIFPDVSCMRRWKSTLWTCFIMVCCIKSL